MRITKFFICLFFLSTLKTHSTNSNFLNDVLNKPQAVISKIESALKSYIETYDNLKIEITPSNQADLVIGVVTEIKINITGGKVKHLRLESGTFLVKRPKIDLNMIYKENKFRLKGLESSDFLIKILESDLNKAIQDRKLPLKDPYISFKEGYLVFRAYFQTLFLKSLVETQGNFEVQNEKQVYFMPSKLKFNGIKLPGFVKRKVENKVNPILDLDILDIITDIKDIRIFNGYLEIEG